MLADTWIHPDPLFCEGENCTEKDVIELTTGNMAASDMNDFLPDYHEAEGGPLLAGNPELEAFISVSLKFAFCD